MKAVAACGFGHFGLDLFLELAGLPANGVQFVEQRFEFVVAEFRQNLQRITEFGVPLISSVEMISGS